MPEILTKKELKEALQCEKEAYNVVGRFGVNLTGKAHPLHVSYEYLCLLHKTEYHSFRPAQGLFDTVLKQILRTYYSWRLLNKGLKTNLDIGIGALGVGTQIWHNAGGIVVNMHARLGNHCVFHGNNCIGNNGDVGSGAPIIGDRVHFGFGSSVIGPVKIASDCWIAAGAVVVSDFDQPGSVIAGVPARLIKVSIPSLSAVCK